MSYEQPCDMTHREVMFTSLALNVILAVILAASVYTNDVKIVELGKGYH